jgi:hypothetical protein
MLAYGYLRNSFISHFMAHRHGCIAIIWILEKHAMVCWCVCALVQYDVVLVVANLKEQKR